MKSIKLTEDHKSKLLEMCKVLFPESKIHFTDDYYCEWSLFLITEDDYDNTLSENKVECHWFEFCMTHLVDKIYETRLFNGTEPPFISMVASRINCGHIVDYLYEEFKKLK